MQDENGFTVPGDTSTVTLNLATGPGTMSGTTSVQAVNGVATFSTISFSQMGDYTISASDGILTGATSSSFVVNGLPAKLAFRQQPISGSAGEALVPAVTVMVEDSAGNTVVNANNSVTISVGSFSGTGTGGISGNVTVTASNGIATFANLIPSPAGTYTLKASSGALTVVTSDSFVISPAASQLVFAQDVSNVVSGSTMYPAVVINIENEAGQVVTSNTTTVTLQIISGPGTMSGTTAVAAVKGVATFSNLSFTVPGTYRLVAFDGDLATATSASFLVTNPPTRLAWGAQPTTTVAGQVMKEFSVLVENRNKKIQTSARSVVTLTYTTAATSGTGTTTVTLGTANADQGIAVFSNITINTAGSYILTASSGTMLTATSKSFTILPDVGTSHIVITQTPSTTLVAKTFSSSVIAKIEDQFGNVIKNRTPITLALTNSEAAGTVLNGTTKLFTSNGMATFKNLSLSQAGMATITATDSLLANTTASFEITATKVLTTMSKPSVSSSYTVGKAFTLSAKTIATVAGSKALWTGPATLVDSHNNVLATEATIGTTGAIKLTVVNGLTAGVYTCHIYYAGDINHTGGSSPTFNLVVGSATTISLKSSAANIDAGSTLTFTATVKGGKASGPAHTGTLTLMDGTVTLGTTPLSSASSSATFTLPSTGFSLPATGNHMYTVVYSGDANYRSSTSSAAKVTVNSQATTLELTPSPSSTITTGSTLTLTATVNPADTSHTSAPARTGTLTLLDGTLTLGSMTLSSASSSSGVFVLPSVGLAAPATGSHLYTVVYTGDPIFKSSTSPTVTVTVNAATT